MKKNLVVNKTKSFFFFFFFFFDVKTNVQILEIGNFEHDHRLILSREMGSIRSCKEVTLQNLFNSSCQNSIHLDIFEVSSSHFLQNILIETSNICFKKFMFLILNFAFSLNREV